MPTEVTYQLTIELNVGPLLENVAKIEKSINESMAAFGFDDHKLCFRSQLPMKLTAARVLSLAEHHEICSKTLENIRTKYPGSNPKLLHFTRLS